MHVGNERDMDEGKVFVSNPELELPHGFDERRRLDVADGTAELFIGENEIYRYVHHCSGRTSTMQTSGSSFESSTGILDTRSIQSWMAFVTWGTIFGGRTDLEFWHMTRHACDLPGPSFPNSLRGAINTLLSCWM